jgi:tripartite-type tricarboxylate transporter receptor subunit TctC
MKKNNTLYKCLLILVPFLLILFNMAPSVLADTYPSKPITLIVPFPVAGMPDTGARVLKPYWEKYLGGELNIINKPGAGGELGYKQTRDAKPDGYTFCSWIVPGAQGAQATRKTSFKNEDFDYIGTQMVDPHLVVVHADDPRFSTISEFIDYIKKHPGELKYATSKFSDDHIAVIRFFRIFGIDPEKDVKPVWVMASKPARKTMLGKYVDFMIDNTLIFRGYVGEGKPLKVLTYMWETPATNLKTTAPTLKEAMGSDFTSATYRGFMTKKGLPADRLAKIRDAFEKAMKDPECVKEMKKRGIPFGFVNGPETEKLSFEFQEFCDKFFKQ